MKDAVVTLILDEGKWLPVALAVAFTSVIVLLSRRHAEDVPVRTRVLAALNLFAGVTLSTMAFGHLLAVSVKLATGSLVGSDLKFYSIGIALAAPSFWVLAHTRRLLTGGQGRETVILNTWLVLTLVVLGLHNLPLAAPSLLTLGYQHHSRPTVGWAIVAVALCVAGGLLVGSLVFMASGQSFEQFSGMRPR